MSEEKKEEQKAIESPKAETPKAETPKVEAPKAETAPPEASKTEAPKVEAAAAAPKIEKPANCADCKKSIKKKRWYYRNGKYFCTKRCWNASVKKEAKKEEAAPAA